MLTQKRRHTHITKHLVLIHGYDTQYPEWEPEEEGLGQEGSWLWDEFDE